MHLSVSLLMFSNVPGGIILLAFQIPIFKTLLQDFLITTIRESLSAPLPDAALLVKLKLLTKFLIQSNVMMSPENAQVVSDGLSRIFRRGYLKEKEIKSSFNTKIFNLIKDRNDESEKIETRCLN